MPIGSFIGGNNGLFLMLAFLVFVSIYYYQNNNKPMILISKRYCWPLLGIFVAVILSFISAYLNYGQGLITSILASKAMLLYLCLPALLMAKPSFKDVEWAVYMFSVIYLIVTIVDSLLDIPIIERFDDVSLGETHEYVSSDDFVHVLEGIHYVGMAFLFSLFHLKKRISPVSLVISLFFLVEIFLAQNRSTLFPCVVIMLYTLCTIQHKKYKVIIRISVLCLVVFFFFLTFQNWIALFEETSKQVGDDRYNRNLALAYFLFEACPSVLECFIGNGFLSYKSTSVMQDMMELGVFNSDVGFVGFWNQFGLIPVFVFGIILAKVIFGKRYSFITKCNAWFIAACSLTTAYFAQDCKIVWACLFLYMYSIENYQTLNKINPLLISTNEQ